MPRVLVPREGSAGYDVQVDFAMDPGEVWYLLYAFDLRWFDAQLSIGLAMKIQKSVLRFWIHLKTSGENLPGSAPEGEGLDPFLFRTRHPPALDKERLGPWTNRL